MLDQPIRSVWGDEWPAAEQPEALAPRMRRLGIQPPRRANRLMQIAHLGAYACTTTATAPPPAAAHPPDHRCGLVLGSSHGNLADTVRMMGAALAAGQSPMPFDFINVSTNLAGFHVAQALGLVGGPNLMVSRGRQTLAAALEIALLEPQRPWLIGTCEEVVWPLETHRRRLRLPGQTALAEASYWLWIDPTCDQPRGRLRHLDHYAELAALDAACRRLATEHDGPLWLATGAAPPPRDLTATWPRQPQAWQPATAGYHPDAAGRAVCTFLSAHTAGLLLYLDRDPISTAWLLLAVTACAATP